MGVTMRRATTDPFNEKIRARIFTNTTSMSSYMSTSGSEHDAESDVVSPSSSSTTPSSSSPPSSSLFCLSHLVQNFLEDHDSSSAGDSPEFDSDSDELVRYDVTPLIVDVINPIVRNNADPFRSNLLSHVTRAVEMLSVFRHDKSIFNRNLTSYLREIGYNAGVCKTRWPSSGGLSAGTHEFIDVISPERYVIDVDFVGEFELARETESYSVLRSALPRVFVGKCHDVKRIVRTVCEEGKRSMKRNGLSLPPWRKGRYMQMKWLGPYKRSTGNHSPAVEISGSVGDGFGVKCRAVGFDAAGDCIRLWVAPVTRTR